MIHQRIISIFNVYIIHNDINYILKNFTVNDIISKLLIIDVMKD